MTHPKMDGEVNYNQMRYSNGGIMQIKKVNLLAGVLALALLAGCIPAVATSTPESHAIAEPTQTPQVIVVTSTPESPQVIIITATPEPATATPEVPTATPTIVVPTAINITSVTDVGGGNVVVNWDATGDFSKGFQVIWSSTSQTPSFPVDSSTYVSDSNARSATFHGSANTLYFVRVCRYDGSVCDVYSGLGYVAVFAPTLAPTARPVVRSSNGTPAATVSPYIRITYMKNAGYGAAVIYWKVYGTFTHGFKILYGSDPDKLSYGESKSFDVTDGTYRVFTVTGPYYVKYYYQMCRFTGTSCDLYSNVYSFTLSGPK
jgi:hypothetical protein